MNNTHPKDIANRKALNYQSSAIEVYGLEFDWITGYYDTSGVLQDNPLNGLPQGYMYVSRPDQRANSVAVIIGDRMLPIRRIAGRRCMVGYTITGARIAYAPMVDGISAAANAAGYLAYTTTWAGSGSNPAIVNGTKLATYRIDGADVRFCIVITAGSSTTFGTGNWTFSLPYAAISGGAQGMSGYAFDSSAGAYYVTGLRFATTSTLYAFSNSLVYTPTVPFTWAQNDILVLGGFYQIL